MGYPLGGNPFFFPKNIILIEPLRILLLVYMRTILLNVQPALVAHLVQELTRHCKVAGSSPALAGWKIGSPDWISGLYGPLVL